MRPWFWLCLLAGVVASQAYLWSTLVPLGIPGEWTWHRVFSEPDVWWNLLGVGVTAVLYAAFIEAGARRLERLAKWNVSRLEPAAWLAGLVVASFVWLWVVQETAPSRSRLGKAAFVLYYSSSSGYFTKARYENPDAAKLLAGYEVLMREHDVLHVGTHPPGLFLIFHGLIDVCERSPLLASLLDATQPSSFSKACDVIAQNIIRSKTPRLLLPLDRRVLWLATLLVMVAASCSGLVLYALVRRTHGGVTAWWTGAFWPAIPAVAVFQPKSDVAFALIGLLIVWAWLTASDRRSIGLAFLAGLLAWCGLMMSLALLPVLLFTALVSVLEGFAEKRGQTPFFCKAVPGQTVGPAESPSNSESPQMNADGGAESPPRATSLFVVPPVRCMISAIAGFAIPTLLLGRLCQINMLTVWWLNYQNHAGFYQQYSRTYWKWLLVNPIELSLATGWPVFLLAAISLWLGLRSRSAWSTSMAWSVALVWGVLWLTGKNSGEAARLWVVFLPWLVWLSGPMLAEVASPERRKWLRPVLVVLVIQLVVCALTVSRVNGFVIDV